MNPNQPPNEKELSNQPLLEQNFIQNKPVFTTLPFWLWLFLATIVVSLIWGGRQWYSNFIQKEKTHEPFLEVTNRQFSVFLWQFPSYMRVSVRSKGSYLPGFLATRENFNSATGEEFVSASPDLLFLYHTWKRLLVPDAIIRPIEAKEFAEFLEYLPEWQPKNWPEAPSGYVKLVESLSDAQNNLQTLPESTLPMLVKQAFQGWKNYFKEGPQINALEPTFQQVTDFLKQHPTYARNYWRNINQVAGLQIAGSHYLYGLLEGNESLAAKVPSEQLTPFLKVALFNTEQLSKSSN